MPATLRSGVVSYDLAPASGDGEDAIERRHPGHDLARRVDALGEASTDRRIRERDAQLVDTLVEEIPAAGKKQERREEPAPCRA
jgi:hypothetical protein